MYSFKFAPGDWVSIAIGNTPMLLDLVFGLIRGA